MDSRQTQALPLISARQDTTGDLAISLPHAKGEGRLQLTHNPLFFKYLRLTPFDISTEEGREHERHRRTLLTFSANLFARAVGLLSLFISLRISLPYLGTERYGVLATILGFSSLLMFLDLGIGNALIGQVATHSVRNGKTLKDVISTGLWTLSAMGLCVAALLGYGALQLPVGWLFKNARPEVLQEGQEALLVFALLFGASLPLAAVPKIFSGLQEGYLPHLVSGALSGVSVMILYALPHWQAGIPAFLLVTYSPQLLTGLVLLPVLMRRGYLGFLGRSTFFSSHAVDLLKAGGLFFALQIGVMAGWGADSLIVSARLGPDAVAVFTVAQRLFLLVSVPLAMALSPLWAAYADATARNDSGYIRRTFHKSLRLVLCYAMGVSALLILFGAQFSQLITGNTVRISLLMLLFYGAWSIAEAWGNAVAMMANGMHVIKPQVSVVILFVVLALPLKIALIGSLGVDYMPLLTLISYFLAVVIPYHTVFRTQIFIWKKPG